METEFASEIDQETQEKLDQLPVKCKYCKSKMNFKTYLLGHMEDCEGRKIQKTLTDFYTSSEGDIDEECEEDQLMADFMVQEEDNDVIEVIFEEYEERMDEKLEWLVGNPKVEATLGFLD